MAVGNKFALLVGCNYSNTPTVKNKLHGCINDVNAVQALIRQRFGFKNITILTDETEKQPTFKNIIEALNQMIDAAKQGDTLLFYFSGGGALVKNEIKEGIPAIIPCDLFPITADYILPILKRLPHGATLTFICDSSYSGGLFDKKVQIESNVPDSGPNFGLKTIPSHFLQPSDVGATLPAAISFNNNRILISSSRANEESVEVYPNGDESKAFSVFSNAIQTLLNSPEAVNPPVAGNDHLTARNTNREVAALTKALLGFLGFDQRPCLNCSDKDAAAPFLGHVA